MPKTTVTNETQSQTANLLDQIRNSEVGKVQIFPYCQVINSRSTDFDDYGFFIKKDIADDINFTTVNSKWRAVEHQFTSGSEPGYMCRFPRFAIIRKSGLAVLDRGTGEFLGYYTKELYNDKTKIYRRLESKYLLMFLDNDNKPLHDKPISLKAKGAFGGNLGAAISQYRKLFEKLLGQKRSTEFWVQTVLDLELRYQTIKLSNGTVNVCNVFDMIHPSEKTLPSLYLFDKALVEQLHAWRVEFEDFGYKHNVSAQAQTQDETFYNGDSATSNDNAQGNAWLNRIKQDSQGYNEGDYTDEETDARLDLGFPNDYPPY